MTHDQESQIVWKLPREQKGRYVAASRRAGLSLVAWLAQVCDAAAGPVGNDPPEDRRGNVEDAGESPRPGMDG